MFNANGERIWITAHGSTLFDQFVGINDLAADNLGNVYMTGYYSGTVDFDVRNGIDFFLTSPGDESGFVAKVNSNSNLLWAKNVASDGSLRINQLARDSEGSLVAAGQFSGITDFDPGLGVHEASTPTSTSSGFLLKLDDAGVFIWLGPVNDSSELSGIAIDSQNDIYVAGTGNSGLIWKLGGNNGATLQPPRRVGKHSL